MSKKGKKPPVLTRKSNTSMHKTYQGKSLRKLNKRIGVKSGHRKG